MKNYTEEFDDQFTKIDFYQKISELLPFVGKDFKNQKVKILIIGESHFFPESSHIHNDAVSWYSTFDSTQLSETEKVWVHNRNLLNEGNFRKYSSPSRSLFYNSENAAIELNPTFAEVQNVYSKWAFYNYFLRPAKYGKSLKVELMDNEKSYNTLKSIIEILQPDHIIFISKLAYGEFKNFDNKQQNPLTQNENIKIDFCPHPGSAWWNKQSKNYGKTLDGFKRTGKQKFQQILIDSGFIDN